MTFAANMKKISTGALRAGLFSISSQLPTPISYVGDGQVGIEIPDVITGIGRFDEIPDSWPDEISAALDELGLTSPFQSPTISVSILGERISIESCIHTLWQSGISNFYINDPTPVNLDQLRGGLLQLGDVSYPFDQSLINQLKKIPATSHRNLERVIDPMKSKLILAFGQIPPEIEIAAMKNKVPILYSRSYSNSITFGPLVIPGETLCIACIRLYEGQSLIDVGYQLTTNLTHSPIMNQFAGVWAATLGLAFLDQGTSPLINQLLTVKAAGEIFARALPPHPRCGCTQVA